MSYYIDKEKRPVYIQLYKQLRDDIIGGSYPYRTKLPSKRNLAEVAMDVGRDHDRFAREMERARDAGCRLVVLVEVGFPYRSTEDVTKWVNDTCRRCDYYRRLLCDPVSSARCQKFRTKPMRGTTMARIIESMERDYGCRFEYVNPRYAARRICELLGVTCE